LSEVYASRLRADLERVANEIAQAEARLEALRSDHVLLSRLWESLDDPARGDAATAHRPRGTAPVASGSQRTGSRSSATSADAGRRGTGAKRGSVRDAVLEYLRACDAPVSVNDIFTTLPSPVQASGKVVVRNTVEALVAKGVAERSREGQF